MPEPFTPPSFQSLAFHCPHCNAYASQLWSQAFISTPGMQPVANSYFCRCEHCKNYSVWIGERMIYPDSSSAPSPNADLPQDIKTDFEEARSIISRSPRGASALLRLCVQKLCKFLDESGGKDLNSDIAALVKKGLNPKIQKSLDIVRVIGNDAVHPGQIDLRDKPETATQLCTLLNVIADAMITQPKAIDSLYDSLPETKHQQIEQRDKSKA